MRGWGEGRVTYVLVVGFLEADVEEPEVFVELDFGGHGGIDDRDGSWDSSTVR